VEAAEALGGSFKLVTLTVKTVKEMTQLPRETINKKKNKLQINWFRIYADCEQIGITAATNIA